MTLTDDKLEAFKASFRQQLADFMRERANDIGNPAAWRPRYKKGGNDLGFTRSKKIIYFRIKDVPENLSGDEQKNLRQAMYDICAQEGFKHTSTKSYILTKAVNEALVRGDETAWRTFVGVKHPINERYAKQYLGTPNHSILEPEDVVSMAYAKLHRTVEGGELAERATPDSFTKRSLFQLTYPKGLAHFRKQPDGIDGDTLPTKEGDDRLETLKEQLPRILEEAKKEMTPEQKEILDIIIQTHESDRKLAANHTGLSETKYYNNLHKIAGIIQRTAHRMGPNYEDAAAIIDWLVKANSKGPVRR